MFSSCEVIEHLPFSPDGYKLSFVLVKVLRGSSCDECNGHTVATRVRHATRGTTGVVLNPTGLYSSFDALRAMLARALSRI